MIEQSFELIPVEGLVNRVAALRKEEYRLVQIGATRLPETVELTYSFDRERRLTNLRLQVPAMEARVPSITSVYWGAFLYENELHDLFNVQVDGMAVDFHGHLYETTVKFPFGSTKPPVATPKAGHAVPSAPSPSSNSAPGTARPASA
jgi:ech hydrogenase subunit D